MEEQKIVDTDLKLLYEKINQICDDCIPLADIFRDKIFDGENIGMIDRCTPRWIAEAGIDAECSWSKDLFEKMLAENDNELTHKLLYMYDCRTLVDAMRDRFQHISGALEVFYSKIGYRLKFKPEEMKDVKFQASPMDDVLFMSLNSVFIYMNSLMDLLYKVTYEIENIQTDFTKYTYLNSKGVIFPNMKKLPEELKKGTTIFNGDKFLIMISNIRNRIIHNGSWDYFQRIYSGVNPNDDYERWILFPDLGIADFEKSGARGNFYSDANMINIKLLPMVKEFMDYIDQTVKAIYKQYPTKSVYTYGNSVEIYNKYKNEITNWSTSTLRITPH